MLGNNTKEQSSACESLQQPKFINNNLSLPNNSFLTPTATKKFIDLRNTNVDLTSSSKNQGRPQSNISQDAYNYMPSLSASMPSSDNRFRFSTEKNINTVKQHAPTLSNSQYLSQNPQSNSSNVSTKSLVQPQQTDVRNLMAEVQGLRELHKRQQQQVMYKANPSPSKRGRNRKASTSSNASSIHDLQTIQQTKVKQPLRYVNEQVQPPIEHDVNQYLSHAVMPVISPAIRDVHLSNDQLTSIKAVKVKAQNAYSCSQQLSTVSTKANLHLNRASSGSTSVNPQSFIVPTSSTNGRAQNNTTLIQSSKHLRTVKHPHSPGIRYSMTSLKAKNLYGNDLKVDASKNSVENHSRSSQQNLKDILQSHMKNVQITPEIMKLIQQCNKPENQLHQSNTNSTPHNKSVNQVVNSNFNDKLSIDKTQNIYTDQNFSQISQSQRMNSTNEVSALNSFSNSNKINNKSLIKNQDIPTVKNYPSYSNNSSRTSILNENKQSSQVNTFLQPSNFSKHNHVRMNQSLNSPVVQVTQNINQNKVRYNYQNAMVKPNFVQEKSFLNISSTDLSLPNKTNFSDCSDSASHFVNNDSKSRVDYNKVGKLVNQRDNLKFSLSGTSEKSTKNFINGGIQPVTDYMEFSTTQRNISNENDFSELENKSNPKNFSTISDDHLNQLLSGSNSATLQHTSELNNCLNKPLNKNIQKSIFEYKNPENLQRNSYIDHSKKIRPDLLNSGLETKLNISKNSVNTFSTFQSDCNISKNCNENRGYVNSNSRSFYNVNEIKSPFRDTNSISVSNNTSLEWSKYIHSSNSSNTQENLQKNTMHQQQSSEPSISCTNLNSLPESFNNVPIGKLSTSTSSFLNKSQNFMNENPHETFSLNGCSIQGFIQPSIQPHSSQPAQSPKYANPKKTRLKMYMMEGQTTTNLQQPPPRPLMALSSKSDHENNIIQSNLQHQQQITPVDDGISTYFDDLLVNAHQQINTKNQVRLISDPATTANSTRPIFDKSFLQEEPESLPPLTIETVKCLEKTTKEGVLKNVVEKVNQNTPKTFLVKPVIKEQLSKVDQPDLKEVKRLSLDLNSSVENADKTLEVKQNTVEKHLPVSSTLSTKRKGLKFKFTKFQSRAGDEIYQIKKNDRSFCSSEDEPASKRQKIKKRKKLKKKTKKYKENISAETGEEEISGLIKEEAPIRLKINIGKSKSSVEKVADCKEAVFNPKIKAKKITAGTVDESLPGMEHRNIFAVMNQDFETKNSCCSVKSSSEKPLKVKLCIPKEKKHKKLNSCPKKIKLKTTGTEVKESPILKSPLVSKTATYKFGFGKSKVVLKRSRQLQKSGTSTTSTSQSNSSFTPIVIEKEVQNNISKISLRTPPRTNFDQVNDEYAFPMDTPSKSKKTKTDQKSKSPMKGSDIPVKTSVKSMVAELINPPSSALKNGSRKSRYQVKLKIKTISS